MKKQVLVDMDGVLADVYTQFQKYEFEELGLRQPLSALNGKLEGDAFRNGGKYVRSEGFFRTVPTMPNSVEGLRYLNEKYKVLIVSSATEFPNSLTEKMNWLNEHYPFITWEQVILCGKKDSIKGDIMIDDHPKNLNFFDGTTYLFTQPHNVYVTDDKHIRIDNWLDIVKNL